MTYVLRDTTTMLRRNTRRMLRYPVAPAVVAGVPVVLLLLFVFAFGDTLGAGIGGPSAGRSDYVNYVFPGILMIAIASSPQVTAIAVAMDMKEGIVARFKTMAIARASVLNGHLVANTIQTIACLILVVGVGLAIGFRPNANAAEWLAATGLMVAITVAVTWLAVGMGLYSKTVEGASNLPMPLMLLPFLSSGFVPTEGMPSGLAWFAEHQPFTPMTDTLRGLLLGTPIGNDWIISLAWCAGMGLVGYLWSRKLYDRDPTTVL